MKPEDIRKRLRAAPFSPFEIELTSGTRIAVRHPENVALTPDLCAAVDHDGGFAIFSVKEVCAIHVPGNGRKKRTRKS